MLAPLKSPKFLFDVGKVMVVYIRRVCVRSPNYKKNLNSTIYCERQGSLQVCD